MPADHIIVALQHCTALHCSALPECRAPKLEFCQPPIFWGDSIHSFFSKMRSSPDEDIFNCVDKIKWGFSWIVADLIISQWMFVFHCSSLNCDEGVQPRLLYECSHVYCMSAATSTGWVQPRLLDECSRVHRSRLRSTYFQYFKIMKNFIIINTEHDIFHFSWNIHLFFYYVYINTRKFHDNLSMINYCDIVEIFKINTLLNLPVYFLFFVGSQR